MTRTRTVLRALAASLILAGLLFGLPVVLVATTPRLPPPTITAWQHIFNLLATPDDGTLAAIAIWIVGWITWAALALSVALEVTALARGVRLRPLPGLGLPASAARQLVGAAALLFIAAPTIGTTPPPAVAAPIAAPAQPKAPPQEAVDNAKPETANRPRTVEHTVRQGETLWRIAKEHLGAGERYPEIAALNERLLRGRPGFLSPGWVLQLPVTGSKEPRSLAESETYTVRRGDTLSAIALSRLGAAEAWPQIAKASRHITQPDGRHLTDPDQIDIGWTLHIPASAATNKTPGKERAEEPNPASAPPGTDVPARPPVPVTAAPLPSPAATSPAVASVAPQSVADPTAVPSAGPDPASIASQADGFEEGDILPGWMLAGLTGAGVLLAGSMWTVLLRKRAAQFRARRPGRTIATPEPVLAPVEQTLATIGPSAEDLVQILDSALSALAAHHGADELPMPRLAAAELTATQLVLHLAEPSQLPSPWAGEGLRWTQPAAQGQREEATTDRPAPYPQLVTIGSDDAGGIWLLNLEEFATLTITGDPSYAADLARYLVASIAVQPWSRDVRVDCIGVCEEVAPLNHLRIRHHATTDTIPGLIADGVAMVDRATDAGVDVVTGRAAEIGGDLWMSRLLILTEANALDAPAQLRHFLASHPGRTGTAIVVIGDTQEPAGAVLHLTAEGRLTMPGIGLDLIPVGLTADEAHGCAALLAQADTQEDVPVPAHADEVGWRAHANQAGALLTERSLPRDSDPVAEPAESVLPEPDVTYTAVAATTADDLEALAPQVPSHVRDQVERDDPTLDDDLAAWYNPDCDLPKLSVLGEITARCGPRGTPLAVASRRPYYAELLAFLALRPGGATTAQISEAFNIQPRRVHTAMGVLREWLGVNPRTGQNHIPDGRRSTSEKNRGVRTYQAENVLIDADLFLRLRLRGQARGADGLTDLRRALDLVTGTPFTSGRRAGADWLTHGDRYDQHFLVAIVDVAHLVTTAALAEGDTRQACAAAGLARRVAPLEEIPRLDLTAVAHAEGNHEEAERILVDDICNRSDDGEPPAELSDRTRDIIDSHEWLKQDRFVS